MLLLSYIISFVVSLLISNFRFDMFDISSIKIEPPSVTNYLFLSIKEANKLLPANPKIGRRIRKKQTYNKALRIILPP